MWATLSRSNSKALHAKQINSFLFNPDVHSGGLSAGPCCPALPPPRPPRGVSETSPPCAGPSFSLLGFLGGRGTSCRDGTWRPRSSGCTSAGRRHGGGSQPPGSGTGAEGGVCWHTRGLVALAAAPSPLRVAATSGWKADLCPWPGSSIPGRARGAGNAGEQEGETNEEGGCVGRQLRWAPVRCLRLLAQVGSASGLLNLRSSQPSPALSGPGAGSGRTAWSRVCVFPG